MRRLFPPQRSTPQTSSACAAVSEITTGSEFLSLLSAIELPAKLLSAIILSFLVFSVLASSVLVLSVLVLLTIVFVIIVLVLIVIPVSSAASGNEAESLTIPGSGQAARQYLRIAFPTPLFSLSSVTASQSAMTFSSEFFMATENPAA